MWIRLGGLVFREACSSLGRQWIRIKHSACTFLCVIICVYTKRLRIFHPQRIYRPVAISGWVAFCTSKYSHNKKQIVRRATQQHLGSFRSSVDRRQYKNESAFSVAVFIWYDQVERLVQIYHLCRRERHHGIPLLEDAVRHLKDAQGVYSYRPKLHCSNKTYWKNLKIHARQGQEGHSSQLPFFQSIKISQRNLAMSALDCTICSEVRLASAFQQEYSKLNDTTFICICILYTSSIR